MRESPRADTATNCRGVEGKEEGRNQWKEDLREPMHYFPDPLSPSLFPQQNISISIELPLHVFFSSIWYLLCVR